MDDVTPNPKGRSGADLIEAAEDLLAAGYLLGAVPLLHAAEHAGAEPDRCAGNRWFAHMLLGDLPSAWVESDAIRRRGAPDPHRFWNGEELRGKRVMLRSLHGFGDAVQMFRFLPRLQSLAAHLIVEVPPRMVEIAPYFEGMGEVITWGDAAPKVPPAWDVQIEIMELPYLFRVATENLEPMQGYLRIPERTRSEVDGMMGGRKALRVGVAWAAGHWNPSRSVPFALLEPMARMGGIEFWSLQGEHGVLGERGSQERWRDVYECGDGIPRLAAAVERMDLVITVDTLSAHLAGALGVPCWVMLQHSADWRWMCGRPDSPWYPSLRLWRQAAPGDWEGLLATIEEELQRWRDGRLLA